MKPVTSCYTILACTLAFSLFFSGCAKPPVETKPDFNAPVTFEPVHVAGISPAEVTRSELQPGLAATYYRDFFKRDLKYLPEGKDPEYPSFAGKPILQINHQFNRKNVFDSGSNRGVGLRMAGYIDFAESGVYELQALSNDGIFLHIDGQLALSDPKQHSDRLSNLAFVTIDTPGWYPVTIEYFQRKGTAALKLFWKVPGSSEQVPLPPEAYGHR